MKDIQQTLEEVLNRYGDEVTEALGQNLINSNHKASGELQSSIRFKVFSFGTVSTFELYIDDYYKFIDEGRKPTSSAASTPFKGWSAPSLRRSILQWLTYKGIGAIVRTKKGRNPAAPNGSAVMTGLQAQRTIATLIARKIHRFGYKGSGFFTKVFKGGVGDFRQLEMKIFEETGLNVKIDLQTN